MAEPKSANAESYLRASKEAQLRGDFDAMLEAAETAVALDGRDLNARFRLFECLLYCGRVDRVLKAVRALESAAGDDHHLLGTIAETYTHCADHEAALRCCRRALAMQPENTAYLYATATAEIAAGDLDAAEGHLDRLIELDPHDYEAWRNRATLKKQTAERNHIAATEALLSRGTRTPAGEAQLCYALAKEYEDLGDDETSFEYLRRGAAKRRSLMNYRVEGDLVAIERLKTVFTAELLRGKPPGHDATGPVFVIGLPRSGTTLVDRILSSHSQVDSLGEINNFAFSLMHTVGQAADKLKLIDLSVRIDFGELGQRYVDAIRSYGRPGPYLVDKTPLNYLYVGLICRSLPNARIVHIHRDPMDSCYGMYRTLFRAGYPFSYDLEDLGRYYVAYRQLMDHWRHVAPHAFLDVSYEALVDDQEAVSRTMIEYCGLDWEAACLEFHRNRSAVMTASSAQVRRPVYRDALQRWRRYERQLEPLANRLRAEGIDVDMA